MLDTLRYAYTHSVYWRPRDWRFGKSSTAFGPVTLVLFAFGPYRASWLLDIGSKR